MMSLRPLAEAKNTVEHNIAAQERAHSVHMKITLFVSVLRRSSTTNCCLTALPRWLCCGIWCWGSRGWFPYLDRPCS